MIPAFLIRQKTVDRHSGRRAAQPPILEPFDDE
jgi:hypothetical protein